MTPDFHSRIWVIVAFLAAVLAFAAGVWWYGYFTALDELERRGQADLALASDSLAGELKRFRELAVVTADHPALPPLIADAAGSDTVQPILREIADKTGALDIVLLDNQGREIVAAEGADLTVVHIGQPYFERAMDGALGVYHLFSPRYARRAFVFAAPVFSKQGPVVATLMVLVDIEGVEAPWRGVTPTLFFTDTLGVIFVSNRSELVFRARVDAPISSDRNGRYLAGQIGPYVDHSARLLRGHDLWVVDGGRYLPQRAVHVTKELPEFALRGESLVDLAPARQLATLQAAVAGALCLAFGALLFLATERRRTLAMANVRLEQRVANRTAELSALNEDLRREVRERTLAETQLKKAQGELVQAGKLAALGQMSAGISHELNQPLMAITSFAENGIGFLEKGKTTTAAQNLTRISEMARRMGRIIRNLRAFAKQENEPLQDVDVVGVVDAVVELVAGRAAQTDVQITWKRPDGAVKARAGEVRLQQVLLNLIINAMDAMAHSQTKAVTIAVDASGAKIDLVVRDTGPGIDEPEKIFEPFYSTKATGGDGMGLGLSISYGLVQSFGGDIRGRNLPEGGAEFSVTLEPAKGGS